METKWVGEIAENCPGVKLVLVALKCDLRKKDDTDEDGGQPEKPMIQYDEGLRVAERIKALRYLGKMNCIRFFQDHRQPDHDRRMLGDEEPRRQRSLHRSCPCSTPGKDSQRQKPQLLCHVKTGIHDSLSRYLNTPSAIPLLDVFHIFPNLYLNPFPTLGNKPACVPALYEKEFQGRLAVFVIHFLNSGMISCGLTFFV